MKIRNICADIPAANSEEIVESLAGSGNVTIKRIISRGHSSPEGFWYDQERNEWVAVMAGMARIRFEGEDEDVLLGKGDFVNIPAHCRHRVEWTDPDQETIWLVIYY